jgi:putative tryptophan/tyrosine transport system substrate-binding protein
VKGRRAFLAGTVTLLAASLAVEAQQSGKAARIGFLSSGSATGDPRTREAFRDGLRDLGWVEGRNLVIEYRFAEGRPGRLPDLAAELVQLKVDVIAAGPTPPVLAAKKATGTIPIVGISLTDPVGLGLVTTLAHPGGNVTGVAYGVGMDTFGKGLELLKEAVPHVRRVAILSNPDSPTQPLLIASVKSTGGSLGLELRYLEAREPTQFESVFATMGRDGAEALFVQTDPAYLLPGAAARLAHLAAKFRLPSMHAQRAAVEAGGLMSYGPSIVALYRHGAVFVGKILKGAKPAELPIEQPTKFELVINRKTAKALGLTIPPAVLARADAVIE